MPVDRKILCGVYGLVALVALVLTWVNGGPYIHSAFGILTDFWRDTRATSASRFISADCLMLCVSVAILTVSEGRKYNVRFVWAYIAASFVAVSVAIPLFLIARERRAGTSGRPNLGKADTIALAVVGCGLTALSIWIDVSWASWHAQTSIVIRRDTYTVATTRRWSSHWLQSGGASLNENTLAINGVFRVAQFLVVVMMTVAVVGGQGGSENGMLSA
jgi:hypothetical protein